MNISLTGGGARAAFQGGFLSVVAPEIPIGSISALSGGVINGYFVAEGMEGLLSDFWTRIIPEHTDRFKWKAMIPFNLITRKPALVSSDFSYKLIDRHVTSIPSNLWIHVVDMVTGDQFALGKDSFETLEDFKAAMYASTAIPGVFAPIKVKTTFGVIEQAADGGIYAPTPVGTEDWDLIVSPHTKELSFDPVTGPMSAILRVAQLRSYDRKQYEDSPNTVRPSTPLAKSWDWSVEALTHNFRVGQEAGLDYVKNFY